MRISGLAVAAALLAGAPVLAQKPAAAPPVVAWEVPAEPGVRQADWATGLENPWAIAWLPDGRALVTERAGRIRIVSKDGRVGTPLAGVPKVLATGQGGLLDMAPHPDFARNGLVYFTHSVGDSNANMTALSRGKLSGNMLSEVRELMRNPIAKNGGAHFGSRLQWLPDGTLLMSVGDGGNPRIELDGKPIRLQAQNPKTWFGSVLRVTADGQPVKNNPAGLNPKLGWDPRVWSMGHRNIQGLARDPETGVIWATEHGPRGGDELNRLSAGANYGWPTLTYGINYDGTTITNERSRPGMRDPVSVWTPSIAASGLAVYRAKAFPQWNGALLAGGLTSNDVRVIRLRADGRPARETRVEIGARVRDVRVGPDGMVYVLTDEENGRVVRLSPTR